MCRVSCKWFDPVIIGLSYSGSYPSGGYGAGNILVDPDTPVIMKINSVFGSADVPERKVSGFGSQDYRTEGVSEAKDPIEIRANVVFSSFKVIERRQPQ